MTGPLAVTDLPGARAVIDWFGRFPRFHDAELLEIVLAAGTSRLHIHAWNMTDRVDANGYFILEKHAVVTISLQEISFIDLKNPQWPTALPSIIADLEITKTPSGYAVDWGTAYGIDGSLHAKKISFAIEPGRRSLVDLLASMPNVGEDADFERVQSTRPAGDVFD